MTRTASSGPRGDTRRRDLVMPILLLVALSLVVGASLVLESRTPEATTAEEPAATEPAAEEPRRRLDTDELIDFGELGLLPAAIQITNDATAGCDPGDPFGGCQ